jgi:hypothetical protein
MARPSHALTDPCIVISMSNLIFGREKEKHLQEMNGLHELVYVGFSSNAGDRERILPRLSNLAKFGMVPLNCVQRSVDVA